MANEGRALHPSGDADDALARAQRASLLDAVRSQLPVTTWSRLTHESATECALCLEEYEEGDIVTHLGCLHVYHQACLSPWLDRQTTCPCCKYDILS